MIDEKNKASSDNNEARYQVSEGKIYQMRTGVSQSRVSKSLTYSGVPYILFYFLFTLLPLIGCEKVAEKVEIVPMPSIQDIPESAWKILTAKKIYFGHQSVGGNILNGVRDIMKDEPRLNLNIVETDDPGKFDHAIWAHSDIGKNGDPSSKIHAFKTILQKGIGDKVDIAFMKFCFWDIRSHTDIEKVFHDYKNAMDELKRQYPRVTFVHFTIPLVGYPDGWVVQVRRMLGMPVSFDEDNIKRNELNKLLLKEYSGEEPVVDIALCESTLPDGKRTSFVKGGQTYYYLAAVNTNDGGHLNETSRKRAAEQLLIGLARTVESASL